MHKPLYPSAYRRNHFRIHFYFFTGLALASWTIIQSNPDSLGLNLTAALASSLSVYRLGIMTSEYLLLKFWSRMFRRQVLQDLREAKTDEDLKIALVKAPNLLKFRTMGGTRHMISSDLMYVVQPDDAGEFLAYFLHFALASRDKGETCREVASHLYRNAHHYRLSSQAHWLDQVIAGMIRSPYPIIGQSIAISLIALILEAPPDD